MSARDIFDTHFDDDIALKRWMLAKATRETGANVLRSLGLPVADARKLIAARYLHEHASTMFPRVEDRAIRDATRRVREAFDTENDDLRRETFRSFVATYDAWRSSDEREMLRHLICHAVRQEAEPDAELTRLIRHLGDERTMGMVTLFRQNRDAIFERLATDVESVCLKAFFDLMREEIAERGSFDRLFVFLRECRDRLKISDRDEMFDVEFWEMRHRNGTFDLPSMRRCMLQLLDRVGGDVNEDLRARVSEDPVGSLVDVAVFVFGRTRSSRSDENSST